MTTEISGTVHADGKEKEVVIVDNGEGYEENGKGQTPNHDKVEIIYLDNE